MKKVLALMLGVILAIGLLAGCGSSGGSEATTAAQETQGAQEAQGSSIVKNSGVTDQGTQRDKIIFTAADPGSLDVTDSQDPQNVYLYSCYECLYDAGDDGELVPVLADGSRGEFGGYDHEAGTNVYTFYICDNIVDSAGNKITASDVAFSYETTIKSGNATNADAWESAKAIDDTTVEFTFQREMNLLGDLNEYLTRMVVFSQAAYEGSASNLNSETIGTGRYTVTDYTAGVSMTMEKRDDYWQKDESKISQRHQANVNTIEYQFITEETQKSVALQNGTVDVVVGLGATAAADFKEGGKYAENYGVYSYPDNLCSYTTPNSSEQSIMHDINMRLAVFYAIDANGVAQGLGAGAASMVGTVGNQKYNKYNPAWDSDDTYQCVSDNDKVKEYLEKAGYNGETLQIIGPEMIMNGKVMEIVQQMLTNAGIKSEIHVYDFGTYAATQSDFSKWDLDVSYMAGGNRNIAAVWKNVYLTNAATFGFDFDTNLTDKMNVLLTVEGNTQENVDEFRQYVIDNAYSMGLCVAYNNIVYTKDIVSMAVNDMDVVIPGGCVYSK